MEAHCKTTPDGTSNSTSRDIAVPVPPIEMLERDEKLTSLEVQERQETSLEDELIGVNRSWRNPAINVYRLLATFWSFIVIGANDGVYGAIIPSLETYYNVNYTTVSLIFLTPSFGYVTSAFTINWMHNKFGQRGLAIVCGSCHMIAYVVICLHPPFPVLVIVFILSGYGNGLADAGWNAWIGMMDNVDEVMGFLHGFYGLGAMLSPLLATTLITKRNWMWYEFYYIMIGAALLELISLTTAFWRATGEEHRNKNLQDPESQMSSSSTTENTGEPIVVDLLSTQEATPKNHNSLTARIQAWRKSSSTAKALTVKITWVCSAYLLIYMGIEVSLGGWIVTFMINIRHGSHFASGMVTTGFWAGLAAGRMVLGFVTNRLFPSNRVALITYLALAAALQLVLWLVPQFVVSAVAVALIGFFIGPAFPTAIVETMRLLPEHLHVSAVGFACAFCGVGATIFPFAVGAIAQAKGVQVLQPIVLSLMIVCLALWLFAFK